MDKLHYALIILLVILIFSECSGYIEKYTSRTNVCNKVDGRCYEVSTKYNSTTYVDASKLLAHLNMFAVQFMRHLRNKYLFNKRGNTAQQNTIAYLLNNYNPDSIIENAPLTSNNTSYVEDKGRVFAICLRERQTGKYTFHKKHILEFVVIHEMAHLASFGFGHGEEYWTVFKFLLKEANDIGLHKPINYAIYPINYCSLHVNYNPFFDDRVPDL